MRIGLIGLRTNSINIFPGLGKSLSKKISGLEVEARFAPFPEDLPIIALEASKDCDFIFVFAQLEDEGEIDFLKQKLVDVELATKTRILKVIDAPVLSSLREEEFLDKKEDLISEYTTLILGILFNENSFTPTEEDFSI
jgi:hypothetical protein